MVRMTEEEADKLDLEITNADITLKQGEGGIFTRQRKLIDTLDRVPNMNILMKSIKQLKEGKDVEHELILA